MATNFPGSLDSFTNPSSSSTLDSPSHAAQHSNVNDAVEAVEAHLLDGYLYRQTVYFTSSGTFTKATYPWLRALRVKMVGAGGGGGGTNINKSGAAGGGGGGYAEKWITNIAGLSASETITIGAGGAGGVGLANGSNGGATSAFSVTGGGGGFGYYPGVVSHGGGGGVGSGGDLNIRGAGGGAGSPDDWPSGTGGSSQLGGGGQGYAATTSSASSGANGGQYGGGGAGATRGATFVVDGGDGYDGIVIVELYA